MTQSSFDDPTDQLVYGWALTPTVTDTSTGPG